MIELPLAGTGKKIGIAPAKIIAVGLNYREHVKESVSGQKLPNKVPAEPVLFAKTPNVLIGPGEAIIIPALIDEYHFEDARVDPEAELAVIIGRRGRHIPEENAFDYVLGYTCFNDVSQRNFQYLDPSGWFRGKSLDTFGPIGPVIVSHKDIGDPQKLNLQSRINGEIKQSGNTGDMIFSVPRLIAFISRHFTLEEGDIIATGTPKGISPIHPGDVVEVEIEGIGVLRNPVEAEKG
ncbi:MAG: fumarylacetoacetate hydrolase family protein [Treponema sp.]|jgi:2-keto-4-pentenoate hydratase/2-oxohepta-3-ene-1,7-dioic acid hydratase in catechol pathway|nr:fumarylacetoacetate hydrolase family protein [Treponema sp.]